MPSCIGTTARSVRTTPTRYRVIDTAPAGP
jgi:hypothetical protein